MSFYEGKTFFVFLARERSPASATAAKIQHRKENTTMKTRKRIALLLSLLTACTLFTACGKAEAAAKPEEEIQIE